MLFNGTHHTAAKANTKFAGCLVLIKGIVLGSTKTVEFLAYVKEVKDRDGEVIVDCFDTSDPTTPRILLYRTEIVNTFITSNAEMLYVYDKDNGIYGKALLKNGVQYKQGVCSGRFHLPPNADVVGVLKAVVAVLRSRSPVKYNISLEHVLRSGSRVLPITDKLAIRDNSLVHISNENFCIARRTPQGFVMYDSHKWFGDWVQEHLKAAGSSLEVIV